MTQIYYIGQQNTPLTCQQYDSNLNYCLNRANQTGTQSASTIYDLQTTVEGYSFITALQTCCTTLTSELATLQTAISGEGQIGGAISSLQTTLLGDIATVQTALTSLTTRVTGDESTISTLQSSITSLSSQIEALVASKANLASPTFTGSPKAPTPVTGDNSTSIATTAFVTTAITNTSGTIAGLIPVGSMQMYVGNTDPNSSWLICDGRLLSRTTYASLFAIIGTAFGSGDGSTTFNIPNMEGQFPTGAGGPNPVGHQGGESQHTLLESEMPSHSHSGSTGEAGDHTHSINDPTHAHAYQDLFHIRGDGADIPPEISYTSASQPDWVATSGGAGSPLVYGQENTAITTTGISINTAAGHYHAIAADGGGLPHNNLPPFTALYFIIKVQ